MVGRYSPGGRAASRALAYSPTAAARIAQGVSASQCRCERAESTGPAAEDVMITLRKASDRFHTNIGWLNSFHTFSFGEHHDREHEGFSALRVINDDTVQAGQGF